MTWPCLSFLHTSRHFVFDMLSLHNVCPEIEASWLLLENITLHHIIISPNHWSSWAVHLTRRNNSWILKLLVYTLVLQISGWSSHDLLFLSLHTLHRLKEVGWDSHCFLLLLFLREQNHVKSRLVFVFDSLDYLIFFKSDYFVVKVRRIQISIWKLGFLFLLLFFQFIELFSQLFLLFLFNPLWYSSRLYCYITWGDCAVFWRRESTYSWTQISRLTLGDRFGRGSGSSVCFSGNFSFIIFLSLVWRYELNVYALFWEWPPSCNRLSLCQHCSPLEQIVMLLGVQHFLFEIARNWRRSCAVILSCFQR